MYLQLDGLLPYTGMQRLAENPLIITEYGNKIECLLFCDNVPADCFHTCPNKNEMQTNSEQDEEQRSSSVVCCMEGGRKQMKRVQWSGVQCA